MVSNYGDIKGLKRGILKQRINSDGYYEVTAGIKEKRTRVRVHRLVALAFISNPQNLPEVNHKDFNRLNNYVENLEWCTHNYNVKYSAKYNFNSYRNSKIGSKNGRAKLYENDIVDIRKLYENGLNIAEIAELYNRGWQTINHIIKKTTWKHVV